MPRAGLSAPQLRHPSRSIPAPRPLVLDRQTQRTSLVHQVRLREHEVILRGDRVPDVIEGPKTAVDIFASTVCSQTKNATDRLSCLPPLRLGHFAAFAQAPCCAVPACRRRLSNRKPRAAELHPERSRRHSELRAALEASHRPSCHTYMSHQISQDYQTRTSVWRSRTCKRKTAPRKHEGWKTSKNASEFWMPAHWMRASWRLGCVFQDA